MVSIYPFSLRSTDQRRGAGASRTCIDAVRSLADRSTAAGRRLATRRLASRVVAVALALGALVVPVSPALGAAAPVLSGATGVVRDDGPPDAFDGGFVPATRQVIIPSIEVGLSRDRPIPLGVTCSCTIDRTGLVSQFDITVLQVVPDATAMIQQLSRFNPQPMGGYRYVGVYVGQQYIAGPQNQAYTATDSDWKATATTERLRDVEELLNPSREYRPRADVYPGNYVNGWLFFTLPIGKPAYLAWNYNFVGERAIWFALQ
jgi:hypothetical protein